MIDTLIEDTSIVVWWGTEAECIHAFAKKLRDGKLSMPDADNAIDRLATLIENWSEMLPTDATRVRAERLLFSRDLRTADAFQLASAILWCGDDPREAEFICQDNNLRLAARQEGFAVAPSYEDLANARAGLY